jgi:hypothetical protein
MTTPRTSSALLTKLIAFCVLLHKRIEYLKKFPRYSLGLPTLSKALALLDLTLLFFSKSGKSKLLILNKIDVELRGIQMYLRILSETKSLRDKPYGELSEKLIELGRIIGGIKKNLQGEAPE